MQKRLARTAIARMQSAPSALPGTCSTQHRSRRRGAKFVWLRPALEASFRHDEVHGHVVGLRIHRIKACQLKADPYGYGPPRRRLQRVIVVTGAIAQPEARGIETKQRNHQR